MAKRSEELRDTLEEEILTGHWRPGDRLEEAMLAERYSVSRTPIREALLQLSASGLIERRPRRGAVVAEIGPRKLMEMFDVMAELEAMCARLAARRITCESMQKIIDVHETCGRACESSDINSYYYENEVFHAMVRQAGRNDFLMEQAEILQKRLKPYRRMQLRARDRVRASYQEHGAIVAAIANGDADAASREMRGHVGGMGERFNDLLATLDASAGNAS